MKNKDEPRILLLTQKKINNYNEKKEKTKIQKILGLHPKKCLFYVISLAYLMYVC